MQPQLTRAVWKPKQNSISRSFWALDSQPLCSAAKRRTGLHDFGNPPVEPALRILLNSLESEANLHLLGRFLMRIHLQDLLETRLRLSESWKTNLEYLSAQRLEQPVFIVGMPRSGSTFLHELLAQDPQNRVPRVWEVMFPVAASCETKRDREQRLRKAAACLWLFRRLAPQADAVYPMRAGTPHECVAIHSYTFLSEEFVSTCSIPSYEAFLHSADLTPTYVWEQRFLQHLQLNCQPKRWILKSPDHVYGLEALFSVFPDAFIIQTHRDPLKVLRSSVTLNQVLRGLYGSPGDPNELYEREARVLAESTERFMQFRDLHPELHDRFIDVKYRDLVTNPVAIISHVYRQLGIPLTAQAAEQMQYLASKRRRYQRRSSAATSFYAALHPPSQSKQFERYCLRFDVPVQPEEWR